VRKVLVLSAAAGALFIGSIFIGVAAATTGSPVLYDARSPRPVPAASAEGFEVEAGGARDGAVGGPAEPGAADHADGAEASDDTPPPPSPPGAGSPLPPSSTAPPSPDAAPGASEAPPSPEARRAWLAFQQLVRDCMTDAGHEYRYWEWWTTEARDPDASAPARPTGLSTEAATAWELAFAGTGGTGDDVAWEEAGCWGAAVHSTAEQRRTMSPQPDVPPAEAPRSTATPTPGPDGD